MMEVAGSYEMLVYCYQNAHCVAWQKTTTFTNTTGRNLGDVNEGRIIHFQQHLQLLALSTLAMNFSIRSGQLRFFSGSQVSSLCEKPFQWMRNSREPFFLKWTSITLSTCTEDQPCDSYFHFVSASHCFRTNLVTFSRKGLLKGWWSINWNCNVTQQTHRFQLGQNK